MEKKYNWLAIAIGNSRLHWAWFKHHNLIETWDTQYLSNVVKSDELPQLFLSDNLIKQKYLELPVYLASVVPQQAQLWQNYSRLNSIALEDIKLTNVYPTMGIDRALSAWGASVTYNSSCLVIDGGTALTFTGVDEQQKLVGGAILPGLRSQLTTLNQKTAALPEVQLSSRLPPRWALDTEQAIISGIVYTAIATVYSYIIDWLRQFPNSKVIFTGGDGELLSSYLHLYDDAIAIDTIVDPNLVFLGIKLVYQHQTNQDKPPRIY